MLSCDYPLIKQIESLKAFKKSFQAIAQTKNLCPIEEIFVRAITLRIVRTIH